MSYRSSGLKGCWLMMCHWGKISQWKLLWPRQWMTSHLMACYQVGWLLVDSFAPYVWKRTKVFSLSHNHKIFYFDYHCQFLSLDHPFRKDEKAFKNKFVETAPLFHFCIWNMVVQLPPFIKLQEENIPEYGIKHNWKKQSIFWRLPY